MPTNKILRYLRTPEEISPEPPAKRKRKGRDHLDDSGYGTPSRSTAPHRKANVTPGGLEVPPSWSQKLSLPTKSSTR